MRRMSTDDPYRAPASPIEAGAGADRLPLEAASRWRRLCNLLVDYVAMASLSFVVVMAYSIAYFARHPMAQATPIESWGVVAEYAFGILVMLLYYTPLEALFGCTLGKLVTGTRVVNERGGKPQQAKFEARPPRKEKPIDPDSPFAKLAALKEQLKK